MDALFITIRQRLMTVIGTDPAFGECVYECRSRRGESDLKDDLVSRYERKGNGKEAS